MTGNVRTKIWITVSSIFMCCEPSGVSEENVVTSLKESAINGQQLILYLFVLGEVSGFSSFKIKGRFWRTSLLCS